jgi:hypothetical protein
MLPIVAECIPWMQSRDARFLRRNSNLRPAEHLGST